MGKVEPEKQKRPNSAWLFLLTLQVVKEISRKNTHGQSVLEAYGNAKTLRNNNSSRFGKWIEIHFNNEGRTICGAKIDNTFLKNRAWRISRKKLSYFYQLCKSHKASLYALGAPAMYHYLNQSGCVNVPDMDDVAEFQVEKSLQQLGFTEEEQDWMFRVTRGILIVGNATLRPIKKAQTDERTRRQTCCQLL